MIRLVGRVFSHIPKRVSRVLLVPAFVLAAGLGCLYPDYWIELAIAFTAMVAAARLGRPAPDGSGFDAEGFLGQEKWAICILAVLAIVLVSLVVRILFFSPVY